jgi:response regulator RpfG family c-di-GMP phosphodiesterase
VNAAAQNAGPERARILCVDDEPNVLAGLALHLRRRYEMLAATGGAGALDALRRDPGIAVVLSDMRMPGMDGASFLRQAREVAPETTRMLLTGQSDLNSAIAAVNEGQIFRFLTKPCPPPMLMAAVDSAVEQHRLVTAERVLLQQTLHGSIAALTGVMALINPLVFGRASRTRQLVSDMAAQMGLPQAWPIEIAGMLSQLGAITLPQETVEKIYYGLPLDEEEQRMAARAPAVVEQLLGGIPRLELIREILAGYFDPRHAGSLPLLGHDGELAAAGAELLRAAVDFDVLEAQGKTPAQAVEQMRTRAPPYRPQLLAALAAARGHSAAASEMRSIPLNALREGMVIGEDVKLSNGTLFVARGFEVSASLIERFNALRPGACKSLVKVMMLAAPPG